MDLGFRGDPFSWTNNQQGDDNILERLDIAMATQHWRTSNPHAGVTHLPRIASDHVPILLQTRVIDWQGSKNYKFEHLWLTHPQLQQVVTSAWSRIHDMDPAVNLQLKLISTSEILTEWNKENFGHLPTMIKKSTEQIKMAQHRGAIRTGNDLKYWQLHEKQLREQHMTLLDCHATY